MSIVPLPLLFLFLLIGNIILFSLFFIWAKLKDDYSVIDICWSLGFVLQILIISALNHLNGFILGPGHFLILFIVLIWAIRLASYIGLRNLKKGEDERYTAWREDWRPKVTLNFYFRVYILQAFLNIIVGTGIVLTFAQPVIIEGRHIIVATTVSLFGILYEAVADYQKDRFKKQPSNKDKPCRVGLWYYSRHPNYFGEIIFWWGLYFFALPTEVAWYAWFGPLFITFFLIKVSGVPLLTEKYKTRPLYADYIETTNLFFPWPPRLKRSLK